MAFHKEVLIDKEVLVNIISNSEASRSLQSSVQPEPLHLLMEFHMQSATGAPMELLIQVTDESDPQLLLTVNISERGYQSLRASQGLLVDFNNFPHRFSELIEKCIEEQQMESSKFVLVLRVSGIEAPAINKSGLVSFLRTSYNETPGSHVRKITLNLEVVERNRFKELCHLSISLVPASLETKLVYLSSCLKDLKNSLMCEREKSEGENAFLSRETQRLNEALQTKTEELNTLKEELNLKISLEVEKENKLRLQEMDKNLKRKSDFDRRLDREKRELEEKLGKQIGKLKSENLSLKKRNEEHCTAIGNLQVSVRDQNTSLESMREKIKTQSVQLNELHLEKTSWTKNFKNMQEKAKKKDHQLANQEKYIQEKEKEIEKLRRQSENLAQEKTILETRLEETLAVLEKREYSIEHLFQEFQKSLDIIKKYQEKEKILEKEKVSFIERIKSQEVLLVERDKEVKNCQEEHENDLQRLVKFQSQLEDTTEKLKEAMEKVLQQENSLRNNENVIARLNKQLNDLESTEAITKKAPLAEAYLYPQQNLSGGRGVEFFLSNEVGDVQTTSTPASASAPAPKFGAALRAKMNSLSVYDPPLNNIPPIPEEAGPGISHSPENKENSGLDDIYLEPTAQPLPVRGILRANAISGVNTGKKGPRGRGGANVNFRGQKKTIGKQPTTAYSSKRS